MEKRIVDLFEEVKTVNKLTTGFHEFIMFSDTAVSTCDGVWPAHEYFLSTRSIKILDEIKENSRICNKANFPLYVHLT